MSRLTTFKTSVIDAGVSAETPGSDARYIRFLNTTLLIFSLAQVPILSLLSILQLYTQLLINLTALTLCGIGFVLNRQGRHLPAKVLVVTVVVINSAYFATLFGSSAPTHLWLIPGAVLGALVFKPSEWVWGAIIALLSLAGFTTFELINPEMTPVIRAFSNAQDELLAAHGSTISAMSLTLLLVGMMHMRFVRNELQIKKLNHQLSEKNIELEQMIYMVTHDLRSPLMNIGGITELMSEGVSELEVLVDQVKPADLHQTLQSMIKEELNEPLDDLTVTTSKMTSLVTSLLEVARLTNKEPSREEVDMNTLISSIFKANAYRIKSLAIDVSATALPSCLGDRALIDPIFSNLIDNAIKYIDPERAAQIQVYALEESSSVIYAVQDTGLGIPASHLESIFRSFSQVDQGSAGYGIGLNTISKFVTKLGGEIWVESEVGRGSTFFVSFPKE